MNKIVSIPERKVPVLTEADVLVCGGGPTGIAAAVSAARHGADVVLIERWPCVGGMGTAALVNGWHRSDRRKVVIYGLVEEAAERARQGGWIEQVANFPEAFETHWFDPEGMKVVYQDMLDEAGVRTFCYLVAGEPITENRRIRGVAVDTKRGTRAILARAVIDATGDGDIAAKAGLPFDYGRASDGRVQGMTMMFRLSGLDPEMVEAHPDDGERVFELMKNLRDQGRLPPFLEAAARSYLLNPRAPDVSYNMCPVAGNALDEEELTRLTAKSRRQVHRYVELWRNEMPGFADVRVEQTGFSLGIRESRRVHGLKTLDAGMVVEAVKQPDAIGHGVWMIDIHDPEGSGHTTWEDQRADAMPPVGESYHIPLGMCLNAHIPNLAVVGRCASSTHEGHSSVRVQTHCMVMGEGVGTCAALALAENVDMERVNVHRLQKTLKADGVYLEDIPE
ncbi:MAG: FAD-dependent oxidoreductase [Candidatus Pacebacteria bacterium]|nr:FAD-dependent oxidoreductase [Candidatus Paceibacterota bacterium]